MIMSANWCPKAVRSKILVCVKIKRAAETTEGRIREILLVGFKKTD